MGLMKISAYHKKLGDSVHFIKGISDSVAYEYWDRIYVSTLFTYNWKATIKTIKYYKMLVRDDTSRIVVGGIMASLMPEELWKETGIVPIQGMLSSPRMLDNDNDYIVEDMIPDYELFDGLGQKYTLIKDSYFGYSTRGCVRKCKFCGVHKLEPKFIDYKGIKPYINKIRQLYGEKCHLVLFDNNILASNYFENVINDIRDLGFGKEDKFESINKAGQKTYRQRHVDFNQGTDGRLMKEWHVKLLSKIAIYPLRIAFDHIKDKEIYIKKIRLANKYGINHLSNYILYNYNDTPEELWQRLKINIDLNINYGLAIYSFPMKYIPLNSKDRSYIYEPKWNWQFVRNVYRILNVNKGSVMTNEGYFNRAWGETKDEFIKILHMPERILMFRGREKKSDEIDWEQKYDNLTKNEKKELLEILCQNRTKEKLLEAIINVKNSKLNKILDYYVPPKKENSNLSMFK